MKSSELVRRFYDEVWNEQAYEVVSEILSPNLSFRGSLGPESDTLHGFVLYAKTVHKGLSAYCCEIRSLIETDSACAAQMAFTGVHTGEFLGFPPTGRTVEWAGAAFFECHRSRIERIWVLGDLYSLHQQLTSD